EEQSDLLSRAAARPGSQRVSPRADRGREKGSGSMAMRSIALGVAIAVLPAIQVSSADPPGFAMWRASELKQHDAELAKHVAADHSSRETLRDYGDHRFRMLYRDADGNPEQHDAIVDIVYVQSGAGTLVMGGTMEGKRASGTGEWLGTRLEGGERNAIGAGDVVHIPAGVPHSFLVPASSHLTYVLLKIPAR